jgi:hypothetical protein
LGLNRGNKRHMITTTNCKGTTKAGKPCSANALTGSTYCFAHDPTKAADRAKARSKGGRARHGRTDIKPDEHEQIDQLTPENILRVLGIAVNDCLKLERSLNRSRTLATIAATAIKAIEATELEARLAALESLILDKQKVEV